MRAILLNFPLPPAPRTAERDPARVRRGTMTDAELLLWSHLRDAQLEGCRFRRMFPIGRYIVDFACLERRVVVEIGGGPAPRYETLAGHQRDAYLAAGGFHLLRFPDEAVLADPDAVRAAVAAALRRAAPTAP
jgi:very-short-patch-repair endonuclease